MKALCRTPFRGSSEPLTVVSRSSISRRLRVAPRATAEAVAEKVVADSPSPAAAEETEVQAINWKDHWWPCAFLKWVASMA